MLLDIQFLLFKFRLIGKTLRLVTRCVNARKGIRSILFSVFCYELNHERQSQ